MNQTTKKNNKITDINHPYYEPAEDSEVTDDIKDALFKWRDELPYNKKRYIIITLFTTLIMLVVFLGIAYGGMKVCSDLDGILDSTFKCHPNFYTQQRQFDAVGMPFTILNVTS